jgi:hypothetical protein
MSRRDLRTTIEIVRAIPFSRTNPISSCGARDSSEPVLIALPTAPPGCGRGFAGQAAVKRSFGLGPHARRPEDIGRDLPYTAP